MSKLFSKIGKAVRKVFRGIKKVFKKITSSKFGRVLLAGVAIYLGGGVLGMWDTVFTNGAVAAAKQTAAQQLLSTAGTKAAGAAATIPSASGAGMTMNTMGALKTAGGITETVENAGILQKAMGGAKSIWGNMGSLEKAMVFSGINAAVSPDEMDIMGERESNIDRRLAMQNENLMVGGINIGVRPSGEVLKDSLGNPVFDNQGLINRRLPSRG